LKIPITASIPPPAATAIDGGVRSSSYQIYLHKDRPFSELSVQNPSPVPVAPAPSLSQAVPAKAYTAFLNVDSDLLAMYCVFDIIM